MFLGLVPITDTEDGNTELRLCVNLCAAERTATARQLPDGEPITVSYLLKALTGLTPPWGSLTGIRPTKLLRELCARVGDEEAVRQFSEVFSVRIDKLRLAATINAVQKRFIESVQPNDLDVYIGIPYCKTRCLYCSFGAELAKKNAVEEYLPFLYHKYLDDSQSNSEFQ